MMLICHEGSCNESYQKMINKKTKTSKNNAIKMCFTFFRNMYLLR